MITSPSSQASVSPLINQVTGISQRSPFQQSASPPIYIPLKTIDMSIIDEKLSNIEHSHPHHEISSKQLFGQETVQATDVNYYNQYSSMILQIIIKMFRTISQVYHPLYLSTILCGNVSNQMIEGIHSSLLLLSRQSNQQSQHSNENMNKDKEGSNNNFLSQEYSYPIISLTNEQQSEINQLLSQYKTNANQSQWKLISDIQYINLNASSVPIIHESATQEEEEGEEEEENQNQVTNSCSLTLPIPQFNLINCLTLSYLYFDWLDTRADSLFTNKFLSSLISENILTYPQLSNSTNSNILSSYYYFIPSNLLPSPITPGINQINPPTPSNQQQQQQEISPSNSSRINKVHPSNDNRENTTQNLLDLFLRKNLSR